MSATVPPGAGPGAAPGPGDGLRAAEPVLPGDVARPDDPALLTAPFWDAAARRVLVRPVCLCCGRSFFTPAWCCPSCQSEDWVYRRSSGRGVVATHTTVHRGPDPSWRTPYVLAVVDVEEGWDLLTRLLAAPPDPTVPGALVGTAVEVSFVDERTFRRDAACPGTAGRLLPAFRPAVAAATEPPSDRRQP